MDNNTWITQGISIITLITLICEFVYTYVIKKGKKREDIYYLTLLKPYVVKYLKNKNVNTISFVKKEIQRDDDSIPKYIFYLVDKEQEEELKKVLIYDYICLYPNDDRGIDKIVKFVSKLIYYVLFMLSLFLLMLGIYSFNFGVIEFIRIFASNIFNIIMKDNKVNMELINYLIFISRGILCIISGVILAMFNRFLNQDRYSMREKDIKKLIEGKTNKFEQYGSRYVL